MSKGSNQSDKYRIDTQENRDFLKSLTEDLLRFGHGIVSPGGSAYYLLLDGSPWKDHIRETYISCRMAHVYSIGHFLGHEGSEALIDAMLAGLNGELQDHVNGGWHPAVTSEGEPLPGKQCYAHAFVILAASSALLAKRPGAKELLENALEVFDRYFWNEEEGMTADTWNTEFTVLDDYRGLNANMHTVEAFLAASDATGDQKYRARAGRIIRRVIGWAQANEWRIPEHFTKDWVSDLECNQDKPDDQFKPYGATPGHGIEWARLIAQWAVSVFPEEGEVSLLQKTGKSGDLCGTEAYGADKCGAGASGAEVRGMEGLRADGHDREWYLDASKNLYGRAVQDGWNADGAPGIVYTTGWDGKPVVHDRMYWTLAEAINTSAVLYRLTGETRYADDYAMFWQYVDEYVVDHQRGSWFEQLDRNNELLETVWPGKPDLYHALQATLIPYHHVGVSIARDLTMNVNQSL